MRGLLAPRPLRHLVAALLLAAPLLPPAHANPAPAPSAQAGFSFDELFARWDCSGTYCGYSSQLCCTGGNTCYTDANDQAQCGTGSGAAPSTHASGGYWQEYTTTFYETDLVPTTVVTSSYFYGPSSAPTTWASATPTAAACNGSPDETQCGGICCASDQYCAYAGVCSAVAAGSSGGATASAPLRGTSSAVTTETSTASPTTTVPFETPVATGANVTVTGQGSGGGGGGGLSGGAIAGIVIGTLAGLFLLALLCFYCCMRGLWGAIFGRRRTRRTTEVEEYERRRHRSSGGGTAAVAGGAGGGRTWYGAARPARSSRYEERDRERKRNRHWTEVLGLAGCLAALWFILGLKRKRNERRHNEEKYSEYSYSSDYYTSASSASSDDRRREPPPRSLSRR